jgi:hypothetical protein
LKGVPLRNSSGKIITSGIEVNNSIVLSNNYIGIYKNNAAIFSGPGHFTFQPIRNKLNLQFYFYDNKYILIGRKL